MALSSLRSSSTRLLLFFRTMGDETTGIKEDFLHLKNHLNLAAKIELQTNEKMYENRLHHLEKMLEEMRHREESFLHIAEETNILKDQVDSLRELSLATIKNDQEEHHHQLQHQHQQPHARLALATSAAAAQPDSCNKTLSLDTELLLGRAALREDSPPTDDINMEG